VQLFIAPWFSGGEKDFRRSIDDGISAGGFAIAA
jgi:hypothetical protein